MDPAPAVTGERYMPEQIGMLDSEHPLKSHSDTAKNTSGEEMAEIQRIIVSRHSAKNMPE
jgi:hypothetical protein